jgi:Ca2+-binding RTX toxin-like protein
MLAADLTVHPATAQEPDVIFAYHTITVPVVVGNTGNAASSAPFTVLARYVPVTFDTWFSGAVDFDTPGFFNVGAKTYSSGLAVGEHVTVNVLTSPGIIPYDKAGLFALMVKVDEHNAVAEDSETNNVFAVRLVNTLYGEGTMIIPGSPGNDTLRMTATRIGDKAGATFTTPSGSVSMRVSAASNGINVRLGDGDDTFVGEGTFGLLFVDGGGGNDRIVGGDGHELLAGGAGKDSIDGGLGNDRLNGHGGNDKLSGGGGADRLFGYAGNDFLDGGSSGDRFDGGAGLDTMFGQSGDDRFFTVDGEIDQLFGGSDNDAASKDVEDTVNSVEGVIEID